RSLVDLDGPAEERLGLGETALIEANETQAKYAIEVARVGREHGLIELLGLAQPSLRVERRSTGKSLRRTGVWVLQERRCGLGQPCPRLTLLPRQITKVLAQTSGGCGENEASGQGRWPSSEV